MKIRQGFVSNSSTTSFLLACKEEVSKDLIFRYLKKYNVGFYVLETFQRICKMKARDLYQSINYERTYEMKEEAKRKDKQNWRRVFFYNLYDKIYTKPPNVKYRGWKFIYTGGVPVRDPVLAGLSILEDDFILIIDTVY